MKGTINLDASKTPKVLTLEQKGSLGTREFIYDVKGDTLRLCTRTRTVPAPKDFKARDGYQVTVFKKVK